LRPAPLRSGPRPRGGDAVAHPDGRPGGLRAGPRVGHRRRRRRSAPAARRPRGRHPPDGDRAAPPPAAVHRCGTRPVGGHRGGLRRRRRARAGRGPAPGRQPRPRAGDDARDLAQAGPLRRRRRRGRGDRPHRRLARPPLRPRRPLRTAGELHPAGRGGARGAAADRPRMGGAPGPLSRPSATGQACIALVRHNVAVTTNEQGPRTDDHSAQQRIAELTAQIEQARVDYYEHDAPTMADAEYDALEKELRALEEAHPQLAAEDSPTRTVGGAPAAALPTIVHAERMQSLDNVFSLEELREWCAHALAELGGSARFLTELKIDGLAINLRYEHGELVTAATRGDGRTGE